MAALRQTARVLPPAVILLRLMPRAPRASRLRPSLFGRVMAASATR